MFWLLVLLTCASAAVPPTCDSYVYCQGPILDTVQMARIFNDSKTFVDLGMKYTEQIVYANFQNLTNGTQNLTRAEIKQFVSDNFEAGNELEQWTPSDFNPNPKFLEKIQDTDLRDLGRKIVALWKTLARKVKSDVSQNPNQYSLMYIPHGFIIPGGRFKEIYYWDTYWIIRGLLISEMYDTARGIIENFLYLVEKLGHVPNGSRVYYKQRSQPPLLTKMAKQYVKYTGDQDWLKKNIHILETELQYWITYRQKKVTKDGNTYILYQYNAPSLGPRPESYYEDVDTALSTQNPNETYIELKSGAESGWDFSSRWIFDKNGSNHANLSHINTRRIIPVDLNSILYEAFSTISNMYKSFGNLIKASKWNTRAKSLRNAINTILFNDDEGVWQDYDVKLGKHRNYFYVSNIAPMWVGLHKGFKTFSIKRVLQYLKKEGIDKYPGGTPTSLIQSGEQWDMPNAWAPLQAIFIQGLDNGNTADSQDLAYKFAQTWVAANYRGFQQSHEMFEKYDANVPGQYGGGGEYTVQAGFGMTNGVFLEFVDKYGETMKAEL